MGHVIHGEKPGKVALIGGMIIIITVATRSIIVSKEIRNSRLDGLNP